MQKIDPAVLSRREFLTSLGAASMLIGMSGCCSMRRMSKGNLGNDTLVVDPHCHIFNSRDLDIYNYGVNYPLIKSLGIFEGASLAALVSVVTHIAPTIEEDLAIVDRHIVARKSWMNSVNRPAGEAKALDQYDKEITGDLEHVKADLDRKKKQVLLQDAPSLIRKSLVRHHQVKALRENTPFLAPSDDKIKQQADEVQRFFQVPAILDFVEGMWNSRVINLYSLFANHREVSLFTPAMMNIDSWFQFLDHQPEFPSTPIDDQVELYHKLSILSRGKMLSFIGFDPRQEIEWTPGNVRARKKPTELLKQCREYGSFVGVKFYPPMTAAPAENSERKFEPSADRPAAFWPANFGTVLDRTMDEAFKLCLSLDFSAMAHTNQTCGYWDDFLDNGKPEHWRSALSHGNQALRLNLAHYGGIADPQLWRKGREGDENFPGINDLMNNFPTVFADIADFSEIESDPDLAEKFMSELAESIASNPRIADRVMYGSDYYMDGITKCYQLYCHDWIEKFKDKFPNNWQKFVGGNAVAFLGLDFNTSSSLQGKSVRRFLMENGLEPKWNTMVNAT